MQPLKFIPILGVQSALQNKTQPPEFIAVPAPHRGAKRVAKHHPHHATPPAHRRSWGAKCIAQRIAAPQVHCSSCTRSGCKAWCETPPINISPSSSSSSLGCKMHCKSKRSPPQVHCNSCTRLGCKAWCETPPTKHSPPSSSLFLHQVGVQSALQNIPIKRSPSSSSLSLGYKVHCKMKRSPPSSSLFLHQIGVQSTLRDIPHKTRLPLLIAASRDHRGPAGTGWEPGQSPAGTSGAGGGHRHCWLRSCPRKPANAKT